MLHDAALNGHGVDERPHHGNLILGVPLRHESSSRAVTLRACSAALATLQLSFPIAERARFAPDLRHAHHLQIREIYLLPGGGAIETGPTSDSGVTEGPQYPVFVHQTGVFIGEATGAVCSHVALTTPRERPSASNVSRTRQPPLLRRTRTCEAPGGRRGCPGANM